ncbi:MAG: peptide deformylase [Phycisphaerales bacterium]|nr:peptide deformylase [Phycisphaerales bacterium]
MPEHAQSTSHQPSGPDAVDPSGLFLRLHPDTILRVKAEPVGTITDNVREVAQRMLEIMHLEEGIGLAAPQVGLPWRMFVCRLPTDPSADASAGPGLDGFVSDTDGKPLVCIDPVLKPAGDLEPFEEGCLSLPDIRGQVNRPTLVAMEATALDGQRYTVQAAGLLARCIQHEVDHLDGVLIIDKFGQLDRLRTRSAVRRLERKAR